uniref:receptor protein-tyrosine kinase n=1 Tax=Acrobeloides nanus TaxID=290746 RepID=A0A914DW47_9BILA
MDKSTYLINELDLTFGKHLGHGYFGVVYCAHWRQPDGNHIKCAIKVLNQDKSDFTQETMNMENLRHENIVQLYGLSFDHKRRVCIVLEYCEGGSLLERLRDREKPNVLVTKLLDYSEQIVKGMQYLEKNGCIHRDLAARNVLLTQNEEIVKIGDFGLSRFVPQQVNSQQMEYEQNSNTPFPFAWCPPEVLSRKYSNASDVWAFGVTLWELFSYGEDPYTGMNRQEVLEYIEKERLRKPKNCSKEIYKIIRSCWEYNAAKRSNWLILGDALQDCKFPIVTAIKPSTVYRYGSGYEYIFINDVDAMHFYGQCKMTGVFGNIEKSLVKIDPNDSIFSQAYKSVSENDRSFDSNFSPGWSAPRLALPPYKKYEVPSSPVPPSQASPSLKPTSRVTPLSQSNDTWTNLGPEPPKRIEIEPRTTSNKLCGCLLLCYIIAICVICAILVAAIIATIFVLVVVTKKHTQEQDRAHNTQDLLDEHGYQICGVENNGMAMIQTDKLIEVIKGSNITYSVLTYSEEYLDRKTQRLALRHAFDIISEVINVDFIEMANTSDVVIQIQYGVDMNALGYRNHYRDVIAYCEKERNQSAPETNSLVQILFDKNIKWAYLDAEKILMKNNSQFVF